LVGVEDVGGLEGKHQAANVAVVSHEPQLDEDSIHDGLTGATEDLEEKGELKIDPVVVGVVFLRPEEKSLSLDVGRVGGLEVNVGARGHGEPPLGNREHVDGLFSGDGARGGLNGVTQTRGTTPTEALRALVRQQPHLALQDERGAQEFFREERKFQQLTTAVRRGRGEAAEYGTVVAVLQEKGGRAKGHVETDLLLPVQRGETERRVQFGTFRGEDGFVRVQSSAVRHDEQN